MAEQFERDDRVALGELRDQFTPRGRAVADAVNEQQRGILTDVDERALVAVDRPVLLRDCFWPMAGRREFEVSRSRHEPPCPRLAALGDKTVVSTAARGGA